MNEVLKQQLLEKHFGQSGQVYNRLYAIHITGRQFADWGSFDNAWDLWRQSAKESLVSDVMRYQFDLSNTECCVVEDSNAVHGVDIIER